jgi:hypothetical protein
LRLLAAATRSTLPREEVPEQCRPFIPRWKEERLISANAFDVSLAPGGRAVLAEAEAAERPPAGAPTDPDGGELYRPAKELLKADGWPGTYKQLRAALDAHPEIRRYHPVSPRTGWPVLNRLLVHLGDWLAYLEKRGREAAGGVDPLDLPSEVVDRAVREVARRKAEVDRSGRADE